MNIIINNRAGAPKKYERFIKWKTLKIKEKLNNLRSLDIYIDREGDQWFTIKSNIATDTSSIYIMEKEKNLKRGIRRLLDGMERYLRKNKEKTLLRT